MGDADSQHFPSVRYEDVLFLIFPKNACVMLGKNGGGGKGDNI